MHHALGVCEGHRLAHALEHAERACLVPTPCTASHLREHFMQARAFDLAHGEERATFSVDAELVNRNDARVVELRSDLRLFEEPVQFVFRDAHVLARPVSANHLHRQAAFQVSILDFVDQAHPARAKPADTAIARAAGGVVCQAREQTRGRQGALVFR